MQGIKSVMTTTWLLNFLPKDLRKTEFSELFVFAIFGIVWLSKFRNFSEISVFFELAKILRK